MGDLGDVAVGKGAPRRHHALVRCPHGPENVGRHFFDVGVAIKGRRRAAWTVTTGTLALHQAFDVGVIKCFGIVG